MPAFARHRPFTAELTFPQGDHPPMTLSNLLQLAVGNGRDCGGGNAVSAGAGNDDHLLDVHAIPHGRFREHANIFRFFKDGTFAEHPEVVHVCPPEVVVHTDPELPINVDGEIITDTPEHFRVDANAIDVIVPRSSTAARFDR